MLGQWLWLEIAGRMKTSISVREGPQNGSALKIVFGQARPLMLNPLIDALHTQYLNNPCIALLLQSAAELCLERLNSRQKEQLRTTESFVEVVTQYLVSGNTMLQRGVTFVIFVLTSLKLMLDSSPCKLTLTILLFFSRNDCSLLNELRSINFL